MCVEATLLFHLPLRPRGRLGCVSTSACNETVLFCLSILLFSGACVLGLRQACITLPLSLWLHNRDLSHYKENQITRMEFFIRQPLLSTAYSSRDGCRTVSCPSRIFYRNQKQTPYCHGFQRRDERTGNSFHSRYIRLYPA